MPVHASLDLSVFCSLRAYGSPFMLHYARCPVDTYRSESPSGQWLKAALDTRHIDPELLRTEGVGFRLIADEPCPPFDLGNPLTEKERTDIAGELDRVVAHVCRKRMLEACEWTDDAPTPPWAITTTLLLEQMLQPFHTPLELWSCIDQLKGQGARLWHEPGFANHDDVRDVLLPGLVYQPFADRLRFFSDDGDHEVDVGQTTCTYVTLWGRSLPETIVQSAPGFRLGQIVDIGRVLQPWFGDLIITAAEQDDMRLELSVETPVRTLAPTPRLALEAIGLADHPQAHEPWPWWLLPQTC